MKAASRIERLETEDVRVSLKTVWRFLVLHRSDGRTGLGEYTVDLSDADLRPVIDSVRKRVVSLPTEEDHAGWLGGLCRRGRAEAAVCSAVDHALQDLRAQDAGVSLAVLIGADAAVHEVPCYANINRRTFDRSPSGFVQSADAALNDGFHILKIAPFDDLRPELCETETGKQIIAEGFERIRAVAERLPASGELYVDCHWRLTTATAQKLVPQLALNKVTWFECPIPETPALVDDIRSVRRTANSYGIRLAGCELLCRREAFIPFLDADAYDVVMPDVKYAGGLLEIVAIADLARMRGIELSLHNPSGPISHAVSLHVAAALGTPAPMEVQHVETTLFEELTVPHMTTRSDSCSVPGGSGLGVKLLRHN